jgi:hypothetical protein
MEARTLAYTVAYALQALNALQPQEALKALLLKGATSQPFLRHIAGLVKAYGNDAALRAPCLVLNREAVSLPHFLMAIEQFGLVPSELYPDAAANWQSSLRADVQDPPNLLVRLFGLWTLLLLRLSDLPDAVANHGLDGLDLSRCLALHSYPLHCTEDLRTSLRRHRLPIILSLAPLSFLKDGESVFDYPARAPQQGERSRAEHCIAALGDDMHVTQAAAQSALHFIVTAYDEDVEMRCDAEPTVAPETYCRLGVFRWDWRGRSGAFRLHNPSDPCWGDGGSAWLSEHDLAALFAQGHAEATLLSLRRLDQ